MIQSHSTSRRSRFIPGWWYTLLCSIPLALVLWFWIGDPLGDAGMRNVLSAAAVLLAFLLWFSWFLLRSKLDWRVRWASLAGLLLAAVGFSQLVRFDGVSGSMVPILSWRSSPSVFTEQSIATAEARTAVDLSKTASTDFPGFLGAARDMRVRDVQLARDWASQPPELVWKQKIGQGWSAFAIVNGVAVTQEQRGEQELVSAYDLATGDVIWTHEERAREEHPVGGVGPRSTPTIDEGRVYAMGATGILVCLDGSTGSVLWRKDVPAEFGISPEQERRLVDYGRSNSPLVVENKVVIPVGGEDPDLMAGLAAFDKLDGKLLWKSPPRHLSQGSPGLARLAETDQLLIVNEDTVSGHDPATGALLWEHPWPGRTAQDASCSQARPVPPDRVLISKGYGRGSALLRLVPSEAPRGPSEASRGPAEASRGSVGVARKLDVEVVWASRRSLRTKFTNAIVHGAHVYALSDGILECVDLETGKRVWKAGRYGHGQILLVGELLLLLSEEGELLLIDPTPDEANRVLGRFQALDGKTWNNLALSGDLLAIRNAREAAVYRLALESR